VLNKATPAFIGMIEGARPALAMSNIVLIPGSIEQRTLAAKQVDKAAHAPVPKVARVVGAELSEKVAGAIFPLRNELACGRFKKHKTQKILLVVAVQPTAKKPGRGPRLSVWRDLRIPIPRCPPRVVAVCLFQQHAPHNRSRP